MAANNAALYLDDGPARPDPDVLGPSRYPETDDEPDSAYAAYTRALWDEQEASTQPLYRTWIQNILFLGGLQWMQFDEITQTWERRKAPKWKEFPVANLCLPYFKHMMAKLTKNRPAWTAKAASTDPSDIAAARLSEEVLEAKWTELRMSRLMRRMIAWLIPTGNAYVMTYWNQNTGVLRSLTAPVIAGKFDAETHELLGHEMIDAPCDHNGDPHMSEDGSAYNLDAEPHVVDQGDIGARVISPFQVRVDPWAECDDDITWMIIAEPLPLREIERRWPGMSQYCGTEDIGTLSQYDNLVNGTFAGSDTSVVSGQVDRSDEVEKCVVLHYYEKQTPNFPGGRYWAVGGTCVLEEPQALPDAQFPPAEHIVDIEVPGRYHGESSMTAIVGLNREYNEVNAMIKEHHNLLLRGKWLVPIGSAIRKGQITAEPGEVIQHTPGMPPQQADLKPLPAAVYGERERILSDIQLVSGVNKISMGQAPPGVTSGRAFLTLQEADDSDLGPLLSALEELVAELAWKFLQLMQKNYTEERLVHVMGANRRYQVRAFRGSDLSGVIDIIPQVGSAIPTSKSAQQSMMIDLMTSAPQMFINEQTGAFDRAMVARLIPVGGLESISSLEDIDLNEAANEEDDIKAGIAPQPLAMTPWQNHPIHRSHHAQTLKSAEFKLWPPEAQQILIAHYMETDATIQAQQQQQMMMQAMAQNGPPQQQGKSGDTNANGSQDKPPELSDHEKQMRGE